MEFLSKLWIGGVRAQKKKKENFKVESKRSSSSSDSTTNIRLVFRIKIELTSSERFKVLSIVEEFW